MNLDRFRIAFEISNLQPQNINYSKGIKGFIKNKSSWNKGIPCSEEAKKKISLAKLGKPLNHKIDCSCGVCKSKRGIMNHKDNCSCCICKAKRGEQTFSEETRKKISIAGKGRQAPKHFINCNCPVCRCRKGLPLLEEQRLKLSNSLKGKTVSQKTKDKLRLIFTGRKMNVDRKGEKACFFGKHHSLETRKKMSLFHGGTGIPGELSEYGPEFDSSLKERVRFRDEYKCQICGCSQVEDGKQLDVHHIDYNKKNNDIKNLISLCRFCHIKTNGGIKRRIYWANLLFKKMKEKYNDL